MPLSVFQIEKMWGPAALRKILTKLVGAINDRSPIEGTGITISEETGNGRKISVSSDALASAIKNVVSAGGAGAKGTPADYYGIFNGAAATFHLLESAPPDPL